MRKTAWIGVGCAALVVGCQGGRVLSPSAPEVKTERSVEVLASAEDGSATFIRGDFGHFAAALDEDQRAALSVLQPAIGEVAAVFHLTPAELQFRDAFTDELGYRHFRYVQMHEGTEVVGGDLVIHVDHRGTIYAANGTARGGISPAASLAGYSAQSVQSSFLAALPERYRDVTDLALRQIRRIYVFGDDDRQAHLADEHELTGLRGQTPVRDLVYLDAATGELVAVKPQIHTALGRRVYTAANRTTLPGTLRRSEGAAAAGDSSVDAAYSNTGTTYNCYHTLFGRDSYNGSGGALTSTVHYGTNYNNAYWNGSQMVYGDGDGQELGPLALSLDVTAHELTHGVTEYSANLVYQGESGALNEAQSDIMGALCETWATSNLVPNANTWKLGEDIWTPNQPGDALRYMNNPTLDGQSRDYYPERYTGSQDNGGVHLNSGIANLAFYLMSQGGTHPRGRTAINVPAIGFERAGRIFYRALTSYYTSSTNFAGARAATVQAAQDLYDAATAEAVNRAWDAVGVPGGSTTPPPTTETALTKDVPADGLSGAQGSQRFFTFAVPANATTVRVTAGSGTGDADLYVRRGARPTTTQNDGKSEGSDTSETVSLAAQAGTYYILLYGYGAYSGVSLVATWTTGSGGGGATVLQNGVPASNLSGSSGTELRYTFTVPAGATRVNITTSGGTGDADLYLRRSSAPTTATFDASSTETATAEAITLTSGTLEGQWHVLVQGYSAFSGVTLVARYDVIPMLPNGTAITDLAGIQGSQQFFSFVVPEGKSSLRFAMSGGTGDADLYVRYGALPTTSTYDYRPYLGNSNEAVTAIVRSGTWYVMVRGYSAFSGVSLVGQAN